MAADAGEAAPPVRTRPGWPALIAFGLASRVVVLLVGILQADPAAAPPYVEQPIRGATDALRDGLRAGPARVIEPWYRWDAIYYHDLAVRGYPGPPGWTRWHAFSPLLSLVMAAGGALGLDRAWVGLLAANLGFTLGLACFGRIALRLTNDPAAAWRACILLVAYPWSFFLAAPYQEPLGFGLLMSAVLAWLDGRVLLAAGLAAWTTAARQQALAFSVALVAQWATDKLRGRPARNAAWLVAIACGVGIGVQCLYFTWTHGDPFLMLRAHAAWGRKPASLANFLDLGRQLVARPRNYSAADALAAAFFAALAVRMWARRGPFFGCLTLLPVLHATSTGTFLSMTRVGLASALVFVEAAELLRNRYLFTAIVVASAAGQVVLAGRFVNWTFVG